jgi:aminoglycoside 6'-N-acetyltransferase I
MDIRALEPSDRDAWVAMRAALWPEADAAALAAEADAFFAHVSQNHQISAVFGAELDQQLVGMLELSVRDYAEGCDGPTPYVEGWYVIPDARGQGVGAALMEAAATWSRTRRYRALASDTLLDNADGQAAHVAVGFEEVERIVLYRRPL